MQFIPKTEKQLQEESLWPDGEYDFEVVEAINKVSKAQNAMIELKIRCYDPNGSERMVTDYIMEAMAFKLRHFCQHTGLIDKYQAGVLDAVDCVGRTGLVKLKQRLQEGFAPKMEVKDYVDRSAKKEPPIASEQSPAPTKEQKDDIPF